MNSYCFYEWPENLQVEPVEKEDADGKGSYILQSEVEKAIKEMKKATGDDDVPGDVPVGENGLRLIELN